MEKQCIFFKKICQLDNIAIEDETIYKMKTQFLPGSGRVDTAVWMHYLDANKMAGEEARRQLHKNVASNIEQVPGDNTSQGTNYMATCPHHENYPS